MGQKKGPLRFWEQAGGQRERANSTRRSPGANEIEIDGKAGSAACNHCSALLCIAANPSRHRNASHPERMRGTA
jgi:hypothetical protein